MTGWLARTGLPTATGLLLRIPRPWSEAVTEAALDAVAALVQASGNPAAPTTTPATAPDPGAGPAAEAVRDALVPMATLMDPSRPDLAARPSAAIDALPDGVRPGARLYWARHQDRLVALVNFRHYMRQEFR